MAKDCYASGRRSVFFYQTLCPLALGRINFKGGARLLPTRGYPPRIFDDKEWELRRYEKSKLAYAALMKFYPLTLEDLPGEIWLPVVGYEDLYHVSNFGRLKSFHKGKTPRIRKPAFNPHGYLYALLCKQKKNKAFPHSPARRLGFYPQSRK